MLDPILDTSVPFFSRRSMACIAVQDTLYFFGGVGANGSQSILDVSNDLWSFDTANMLWNECVQQGERPSPRRCVGYTAIGHNLFVWGGSGVFLDSSKNEQYNFLNDEWIFDPVKSEWSQLDKGTTSLELEGSDERPEPRYTPNLASSNGEILLFGGYTEDKLGKRKMNDLWFKSEIGWRKENHQYPAGYNSDSVWPGVRYGAMSVLYKEKLYIFGGFSDGGDHNDLWLFDLNTKNWECLSNTNSNGIAPQPRYCGAFCEYNGNLFLFGGRSRQNAKLNYSDLWIFDISDRKWNLVYDNLQDYAYDGSFNRPSYHAKMSFAQVKNYLYIWGGEGRFGHVSDFWRLDCSNFQWSLIQRARADDPKFW